MQSSCQFPDFLLLPSTNVWWSGSVSKATSSTFHTQFAQLIVRGDLRQMILSYPLESPSSSSFAQISNPYPLGRFSFQNHPPGVSNSTDNAIHVDLRCDQMIDKATETYLVEIQFINTRLDLFCYFKQIFIFFPCFTN